MKFAITRIVWPLLGEILLSLGVWEAIVLEGTSAQFLLLLMIWLCSSFLVALNYGTLNFKDVHGVRNESCSLLRDPSLRNCLRVVAVSVLAYLFLRTHVDDPLRILYVSVLLALIWKKYLWVHDEPIATSIVTLSLLFGIGVLRHGWWYCDIEGIDCRELSATYLLGVCAVVFNIIVIWRALPKNIWEGIVLRLALLVCIGFLSSFLIDDALSFRAFHPLIIDSSVGFLCVVLIIIVRAWALIFHCPIKECDSKVRVLYRAFIIVILFCCIAGLGSGLMKLKNLPPLKTDVTTELVEIPDQLIELVLTAEDPIYFHHAGVDFVRIRDALAELIREGEYRRGGSTIAMQLAKVYFLSYERKLGRKLFQILLALMMEIKLSKSEILVRYLEGVPLSAGATGWKEGVAEWYSVDPRKLSTDEMLRLVLAIYNPTHSYKTSSELSNDDFLRGEVIKARAKKFGRRLRQLWETEKQLYTSFNQTASHK